VDIVSKAWTNAEPPFIRYRREATNAENEYRKAVRTLDRHRLKLEERIEETLRTLQGWESDRLHAVKSGTRVIDRFVTLRPRSRVLKPSFSIKVQLPTSARATRRPRTDPRPSLARITPILTSRRSLRGTGLVRSVQKRTCSSLSRTKRRIPSSVSTSGSGPRVDGATKKLREILCLPFSRRF
jgi:hypothetical protein